MAYEAALWKRVKAAGIELKKTGVRIDLKRVENSVGSGHPDVEGAIEGQQIWMELKSCERPKKPSTPIRPKVRTSQNIWLQERVRAGFRHCYVLMQVGEGAASSLYLIPGHLYPHIITVEDQLNQMSVCEPDWPMTRVLTRAELGFSL